MKQSHIFKLFLLFLFCSSKLCPLITKKNLFKLTPCPLSKERVVVNPDKLLKAAKYALWYFTAKRWVDRSFTRSKVFDNGLIPRQEAINTLKFIIKIIEEDKKKKRKPRILNHNFLKKNFDFIRWHCDRKAAERNKVTIPKWYDNGKLLNGKIKLTSYAVFKGRGSPRKTKKHNHALYEIISDDFRKKLRFKHSKQDVFGGVLEQKKFKKHVKPLVWLSRKDVEEALMQGSMIIQMPNGKEHLFNVHKSNGLAYDKKIKNRENQKKYWFFKERKSKNDPEGERFIPFLKFGGTAFAGDVRNLGLGKIIALKYKNTKTNQYEFRFGVLADRGSAFVKNLFQLDMFAGVFSTKDRFKKYISRFPPSVTAYILKKRAA